MASESDIEAAADVVLRWDGEFDGGTTRLAAQRLAKWARDRLAADRAEREERARPIDAEWLESIGFTMADRRMRVSLPDRGYLWISQDCTWGIHQGHDEAVLLEREWTRGDVLDLLRVLKGGG